MTAPSKAEVHALSTDELLGLRQNANTDFATWRLVLAELIRRDVPVKLSGTGSGIDEASAVARMLEIDAIAEQNEDLNELLMEISEFVEPHDDRIVTRPPLDVLARTLRSMRTKLHQLAVKSRDLDMQNTVLYNTKKAAIDEGEKHRSRAQRVEKKLANAHTFIKDLLEE